jgi:hypothetical protein
MNQLSDKPKLLDAINDYLGTSSCGDCRHFNSKSLHCKNCSNLIIFSVIGNNFEPK